MANKGWIKLHRAIQDNSLWLEEPFTKGQAWVDLILLATHEDSEDGKYKKGCVYKSTLFLANRWHWSRGKVRTYLSQLSSQQMIQRKSHPNGQVLTLVNYGFYQYGEPTKKPTKKPTNDTTTLPHTRNKEIYADKSASDSVNKSEYENKSKSEYEYENLPTLADLYDGFEQQKSKED